MHWIDLTIMCAYMAFSVGVGIAARGKKESTEDYFTAEGSMNSWFHTIIVGLSIAGTFFSGITFISYPSVIYTNGLLVYVGVTFVSLPLAYLVLRYWFLPRYLGKGWKFPYEVIEHRFGAPARTAAATLFILMRIGWMATMIYAPTIAIMAMGRLDDRWFWPIVLITGLSNTLLTVISGVRGVIVSEAIQMCVIAVGILGTIVYALVSMPVPLDVAWGTLVESGHMHVANFSLDPTLTFTVWTVVIGTTVSNLTNYIADQMSLQRYLATGDARAAIRAFAVNILGVVVVISLLTMVGLSLFAFYAHTDDANLPTNPDKVFPHFVATRLPVGLAGLVLAALLAATSIPSGINTLAGVLTLDFHARLKPGMTDRQQLLWARIYSVLLGVTATLAAGVVSKLGRLYDLTQIVLGVFARPLLACMVLAVTQVRCGGRAVVAGILIGWVVGMASAFSNASSLWVAPLSATTTLLACLAISALGRRMSAPPAIAPLASQQR
jgi:SSS family solute:Na+ symporter